MSVPPARVPCVGHPDAAAGRGLFEDTSSCDVALGLELVLHTTLSELPLHQRLGAAALVCKQWRAAATHVTADAGIDLPVDKDRLDDVHPRLKKLDLVP